MKKSTIYFLRHGEVYNPKQVLYGRLPGFSLSTHGKETIRQIAKYFEGKGISRIYTSPLLRTRQTAEIIGDHLGLAPKVSILLNEVKLIFDGVKLSEFREKFQPNLYSKENIRKGQESIDSIGDRMVEFLQFLQKQHKGENILVVSHGDPIMILKAKTSGVPFTIEYKKANYLKTSSWFTLIVEDGKYVWE